MTFYISKIFWLLAQPLSLALFLILAGLGAGFLKWNRTRTWASAAAALLLFATLFTSSGAVLLQKLEDRIPRAALPAGGPICIITLGGGFESEVVTARGGFEMTQAGDRFVETLRLALEFPQARILISGGDGSLSGAYEGDAIVGPRFLEAFGVPATRVIRETESRDTFENAGNTQDLLKRNGLENCLLVTSAFHMPRSVGLFRKLGLTVLPWPTDYRTTGTARLGLDLTQPSINAQLMTTAMREWTGLAFYRLAGRTDAFLPQ
ncbi:YdcF family protein [Shinella zoogloeoides]|uniref:YdcF family protein n=1 Tax=Shinella zoogloeoides TaxID=352475 RepID=UPI001F56876A|nr:YdcF family protein [Shinella zoogloeoides]